MLGGLSTATYLRYMSYIHAHTHAHKHTHTELKTALAHTYRQPEARKAMHSSLLAVAWRRWSRQKIRSPDPFRLLIEWHGIKGDQRPDTLIEKGYLVWATPRGTLYCWHFAWEIQRETGQPKSILSWLCVQQVGGWSKWSWQMAWRMAAFVCIMCVPECLWVESSESAFFLSAVER